MAPNEAPVEGLFIGVINWGAPNDAPIVDMLRGSVGVEWLYKRCNRCFSCVYYIKSIWIFCNRY